MSKIICICPTHRDDRELKALSNGHTFLHHDYASVGLEDLAARDASAEVSISDAEREIETILNRCRSEGVQGVISTDDYPGTTLASIVANELGLPNPKPRANLFCQHKFYSREIQAAIVPEAAPEFHLIDVRDPAMPEQLRFPLFVKPVKSFFSVGAQRVESPAHLVEIKGRWARSDAFFQPFEILFRKHTGLSLGTNYLLAEGLLEGVQTTLDGFVFDGEVSVMGVVDSIMFPNTIAFQRFEYPSSLPERVQVRMADVARKLMPAFGFDNGQFNIEFIYNPKADTVHIVEINPRMSSQFADLFEKVDGTNSYSVLLDLALGRKPKLNRNSGQYPTAASCVLRTFQNQRVVRLPSRREIEQLRSRVPDLRIEIIATEGRKLSEQMQDECSYRYGVLNIGGQDRDEILEKVEYCKRNLTFVFEPI